jgi:hypothetical protein
MPHRGGLRLSVFALTCAVGLGAAASAPAKEVTLWSGPLHVAPGSAAGVSVPPGFVLKRALLTRSTTFPEGVSGEYAATFRWYTGPQDHRDPIHSQVLDSATTSLTGDVTVDAPDTQVGADGSIAFGITGAGASADLQRVGLVLDDGFDPTGAVGGIGNTIMKPAIDPTDPESDGYTHVAVPANDVGAGLWKAELYVDGVLSGTVKYVNAGGAGQECVNALDTGNPLPLKNDCQMSSNKFIRLDSTQWPDGPHTLAVKVYDASGRVASFLKDYATEFKNGRDPSNCSPTCNSNLSIGSGSSTQSNGGSNGGNGNGGVAGASATSCNSPRLSMELSQKPLKVSKGVPVLLSGKRYRFRGKLTCLDGGKRKPAAVKTPIELLNAIGKKTYRKGGATVRSGGAITMILSYKSSRTLVFRYTNPDGRRTQVKLKIKVVKKSR